MPRPAVRHLSDGLSGGNGGEDGGLRSCLPEKDKNKYKKRRREKRRRFRLHVCI